MIKNYLKITLRNLRRNLSYVLINTLGLGISLACCITAYVLIAYNIEFDNFHKDEKVSNIYKVESTLMKKDGTGVPFKVIAAPMVMAPMLAEDIAGIEQFTRYYGGNGFMRYGENSFAERVMFADSSFFEMFDFPVVAGSTNTFKNKYSIIINENIAKKYFGDEDPIGKAFILNFPNDMEINAVVGAVLKNVPFNNSFYFSVMMRMEQFIEIYKIKEDNWGDWHDPNVFVKVSSPQNVVTIGNQLKKYIPLRNNAKDDVNVKKYELAHFRIGYTEEIDMGYLQDRIPNEAMIVFCTLGVIILLIACFNLTNTSIAMTARRLKEIGVRKSIGAQRRQIVFQFLMETVIIILISLGVSFLCAQLIVPEFTAMWGIEYSLGDLNGINMVIAMLILVFLASLLAGVYPALFNSRFNPIALLKSTVKIKGTNFLTRILLTFQFALCVIVLIAGVIFTQNMAFQEKIQFGYDKDMIISVQIQNKNEADALEAAIKSNRKVLSTGTSDHQVGMSTYRFPVQIDTSKYEVRHMGVGRNYFETMGINLAEGRTLDLDRKSDMDEGLIVNRAFLKEVGLEQDPLQKAVTVHETKRYIVGVVENHVENINSVNKDESFVFYPSEEAALKWVHVKVEASDLAETEEYLRSEWKTLYPGKPFESILQDEVLFRGARRTNGNLQKIFLFLSVLGAVLSVSGIFSLASLNIAKRTKEIGIRKALGASIQNIVTLVNREFMIILCVAGIVGSVLGFFGTDWLLGIIYDYHMPISYLIVALCAMAIILVGLITTSTTIFKAAKANPVDTLRDE